MKFQDHDVVSGLPSTLKDQAMAKTLSLGIAASLLMTTYASASDTTDRSPVVYVIPLVGQMGTDIHPSIYEDVIDDVNEVKPDLVIFQLDSADVDNNFHIENDDRREAGIWGNIVKMRTERASDSRHRRTCEVALKISRADRRTRRPSSTRSPGRRGTPRPRSSSRARAASASPRAPSRAAPPDPEAPGPCGRRLLSAARAQS